MASEITHDELMAELARIARKADDGPPGFVRRDVQRLLGVGEASASARIRMWAARGDIVFAGHRKIVHVTGAVARTPVYQVARPSGVPGVSGRARTAGQTGQRGGRA